MSDVKDDSVQNDAPETDAASVDTGMDEAAVGAKLAEALDEPAWRELTASLITGGKSNLTFRLSSSAGNLILRRPPTGHLLPKAHDMGREARVQKALGETAVPVPAVVYQETEADTLSAPFYVMEQVDGLVLSDSIPADYAQSPEDRTKMSRAMIDTLGRLHAVDPAQIGLADYGRPEGFMERQLRTWAGQWERSKDEDVADVDELARRLNERIPEPQSAAIVHGDFRLDNCLMDPSDPGHVLAVLDWELSTLGDPLADLGLTLFYWRQPEDEIDIGIPSVSTEEGFPGRDDLRGWYAEATGFDLSDLAFYEAFSRYKYLVIVQGVLMRAKSGAMGDQDFGLTSNPVSALAAEGLRLLDT